MQAGLPEAIDGVIEFPGVTADIVAKKGGPVSIYSWSGDGSGRTREALQTLKTYGNGHIEVHDPGEAGDESRNYWDKMLAEGYVCLFIDSDGDPIQ